VVDDDSDEEEPAASYDAASPSPAVAQKQVRVYRGGWAREGDTHAPAEGDRTT
jgi:hypothetical protein